MDKTMATLTKYGAIVAKNYYRNNNDITITVGKDSITLTIRNSLYELFETGRVNFIKFPQGQALFIFDDKNGFKLSQSGSKENRHIQTTKKSDLGKMLAEYEGEHNLSFDDNVGWCYIKKGE